MGDTTGLVSYWLFDEDSAVAKDSFSINNLTESGAVTTATGAFGNGHRFSGVNDHWFITHASQTNLNFLTASSFTLGIHIQAENFLSDNRTIFSKADANYAFITTETATLRLRLQNIALTVGSAIWSVNVRKHAAVVFDNSADTVKYYASGILDTTIAAVTQQPPGSTSGFSIAKIRAAYNSFGGTNNVTNALDEPFVFGRILTQDEISAIANQGIAAFATPAAGQPMSLRRGHLKAMGTTAPNVFQRI